MALYDEAKNSYAAAAGIAAGDAAGMPKKSSEMLVIDAVRCALSAGDGDVALQFLNSAVRNSKDESIQAQIKLYEQKTSFHGNGTLLSRTFFQEKHACADNTVPERAWWSRIHRT